MIYRLTNDAPDPTTKSVTLDFRMDDTIQMINADVRVNNAGAAVGDMYWELSFLSTMQKGVHDTTGVIASGYVGTPSATAAAVVVHNHIIPVNVQVSAGERIYLHVEPGGVDSNVNVHLHTSKGDQRAATRRR